MLKEVNEELAAKVDRLVNACAAKSRGETFTRGEMQAILKCRPYQGIWTQAVAKLKKRMETDHGVTLEAVRGAGYLLMPIRDQLDRAPRKRIRFALRHISRGIKHVEAPIGDELTEHDRRKKLFVLDGLKRKKSELHGETIRQGIFAKREDGPPRVPFR